MAYCRLLYESLWHTDDTFVRFENRVSFHLKIRNNAWEFNGFFLIKKNREVLTMLCSVVKHLCIKRLEHSSSEEKYPTTSRISPCTSYVL